MLRVLEQSPQRVLALIDADQQATPWLSVPDEQHRFSLSIRPVSIAAEQEPLVLATAYETGARTQVWLERKRPQEQDQEARRVALFEFDDELQGAEQTAEIDSFWQVRLAVPPGGYGQGIWAMELSLS